MNNFLEKRYKKRSKTVILITEVKKVKQITYINDFLESEFICIYIQTEMLKTMEKRE